MTPHAPSLETIGRRFGDSRIHHVDVAIDRVENGRCVLRGAVLDEESRAAVRQILAEENDGLEIDDAAVRVLRQQPPALASVTTNITGLYAAPTFGSEMASQLLGGWPVEILQEKENWRHVRQPDGYLGWAYGPYLGPPHAVEMTHLCAGAVVPLRAHPSDDAPLTSRLLAGTPVAVTGAEAGWRCIAPTAGHEGWLPAAALRPLDELPQEEGVRRAQIVADAHRFTGVPYQWGGVSPFGFDCSGFAQALYRLAGLAIPRDADMQLDGGRPVEPPFAAGDLLFFGSEGAHRRISHVGVSLGGWLMIHASRSRNGVYVDDVQEVAHLRDSFAGAAAYLPAESG